MDMRSIVALFLSMIVTSTIVIAGCRSLGSLGAVDQRCAQVRAAEPVHFHGQRLVEIPDITDSGMRRANALLSAGCIDDARIMIEEYMNANPNDPQGIYVLARLIWIGSDADTAERLIEEFVAMFPDFVSARVLLAGVRIEQYDAEEASRALKGLDAQSPTDMWIYVDRLRIEALTKPSDQIRSTLLDILDDSRLPPNVREAAAIQVRRTRDATVSQMDASYRGQLGYHSGLRMGCKLRNYAWWLIESQGRFEDARQVIEDHWDGDIECPRTVDARDLLGYAYLALAAEIAPRPTSANAHYVDRADDVLNGEYADLASWLVGRPLERTLAPFIEPHLDVNAIDRYGRTRICNAVLVFDVNTVRAELARGADPNGRCGQFSLAIYVAAMITTQHVLERQQMLTLLLEAGATPEQAEFCADSGSGDCSTVLLPIFQQYGFAL